MDEGLVMRRIHCPFCAEPLDIQLDLSAGDQSYIEDCQVCCQPIQVSYTVDDRQLDSIDVQCAS